MVTPLVDISSGPDLGKRSWRQSIPFEGNVEFEFPWIIDGKMFTREYSRQMVNKIFPFEKGIQENVF